MNRLVTSAGGIALVALLAACSTRPVVPVSVNVPAPVAYPSTTVVQQVPVPVAVEYGRVSNIEYYPGGVARTGPNVPGAILGGVAGAVIGHQIGGGSGRDAATVLGGVAGAAIGSQAGRTTTTTEALYRVTVTTDSGIVRYYDVPATGDLRVGDRVRIDAGVIYRS